MTAFSVDALLGALVNVLQQRSTGFRPDPEARRAWARGLAERAVERLEGEGCRFRGNARHDLVERFAEFLFEAEDRPLSEPRREEWAAALACRLAVEVRERCSGLCRE